MAKKKNEGQKHIIVNEEIHKMVKRIAGIEGITMQTVIRKSLEKKYKKYL